MIKPIMYKKRKFTPKKKTVKKYPKEKTNKWAPKVSTKEYKFSDNLIVAASLSTFALGRVRTMDEPNQLGNNTSQ